MTKCIWGLAAVSLLLGCAKPRAAPEFQELAQPVASRLYSLELKAGMDRAKVEAQVSALLSRRSQYSPYWNNLVGGTVRYRDGDWILTVVYKAGAPAPTVKTPDGSHKRYPPIDETVVEYEIRKIPDREPKATNKHR